MLNEPIQCYMYGISTAQSNFPKGTWERSSISCVGAAGSTNGAILYASTFKFTVPAFTGASRCLRITFGSATGQLQYATKIRYAICTADTNIDAYCWRDYDASSYTEIPDVYDPNCIASGAVEFTIKSQEQLVLDIDTDMLKSGKTYHVVLYACGWQMLTILSTSDAQNDTKLFYNSCIIHIDDGNGFAAYTCHIDDGTKWDLCLPLIDTGNEWHACN